MMKKICWRDLRADFLIFEFSELIFDIHSDEKCGLSIIDNEISPRQDRVKCIYDTKATRRGSGSCVALRMLRRVRVVGKAIRSGPFFRVGIRDHLIFLLLFLFHKQLHLVLLHLILRYIYTYIIYISETNKRVFFSELIMYVYVYMITETTQTMNTTFIKYIEL